MDETPTTLAAYEAAPEQVPVVSRVIFLLHRVDALSYDEIARRLSISDQIVQACVAQALGMIAAILDGDVPKRWKEEEIAPVEAELRQRYRASCEQRLRALGCAQPLAWDSGQDDDLIVTRAFLQALPGPLLETFLLNRVDGLNYRRIARHMRTFRWVVRRRMLHVIRYLGREPLTFERWLRATASK